MAGDIRIQGPDNVELHIFPNGDFYSWTILNDNECRLQKVLLEIEGAQSLNSKRRVFREPDPLRLVWHIQSLKSGDETKPETFLRYEGENLGFGSGVGTFLLPWPTGDHSATRCWSLNVRVLGLSEPWRIELYLRWAVGSKTLELLQFSDADSACKSLITHEPAVKRDSSDFQGSQQQRHTPGNTAGRHPELELTDLQEIHRELDRDTLERKLVDKFAREQIMGKRRYSTELYHPSGRSRVTFSPEEHAKLRIEGWREEREEGKEYRVWTADQIAQPPTQTPDKAIANETSEQRKVRRAQRLKTAQERWHPIAKRKIAFSWVHAAAGVDHKDAYNGWKDGTLPDSSSMVVSIDRILNQPEPPKRPVKTSTTE